MKYSSIGKSASNSMIDSFTQSGLVPMSLSKTISLRHFTPLFCHLLLLKPLFCLFLLVLFTHYSFFQDSPFKCDHFTLPPFTLPFRSRLIFVKKMNGGFPCQQEGLDVPDTGCAFSSFSCITIRAE